MFTADIQYFISYSLEALLSAAGSTKQGLSNVVTYRRQSLRFGKRRLDEIVELESIQSTTTPT